MDIIKIKNPITGLRHNESYIFIDENGRIFNDFNKNEAIGLVQKYTNFSEWEPVEIIITDNEIDLKHWILETTESFEGIKNPWGYKKTLRVMDKNKQSWILEGAFPIEVYGDELNKALIVFDFAKKGKL